MTEREITDLLLLKHSTDIAIPQCKTGSSWTGPVGSIVMYARSLYA